MRETCAPPKERLDERAAVFAREGHALGDALVDDVDADLGEAVDVGFAGAEVAALDGVVEEAVDAVAVILIILGGVDAALRGDGMGAARRILEAEALDVVAELAERGGGGAAGEAGADDDDRILPPVGWIDQLHLEARAVPRGLDVAGRSSRIELHYWITPRRTETGTAMKPMARSAVKTLAKSFNFGV